MELRFKNTLGVPLSIYLGGRLKSILDPQESMMLDINQPGVEVCFAAENLLATAPSVSPAQIEKPDPITSTSLVPPEDKSKAKVDAFGRPVKPATAVDQLDADGRLIHTYASMSAAAKDHKVYWTDIAKACDGQTAEAGGYRWRRSNPEMVTDGHLAAQEFTETEINLRRMRADLVATTPTPILRFTSQGKQMGAFTSKQSAIGSVPGMTEQELDDALNGVAPYAGGYIWKMAGEPTL